MAASGTAKRVVLLIAILAVLPFYLLYRINLLFLNKDAAFQGFSQFMSLWPGVPGNLMRKGFYWLTLRRCSPDCTISFGTIFSTPNCEIGQHVYIGAFCVVSDSIIQDDVLIGSHVHIISGKNAHGFEDPELPIRLQPTFLSAVHVGQNSWIGNGAIVMAAIGQGCVIGAGSIVTREIPGGSVAVGNPARVVKARHGDSKCDGLASTTFDHADRLSG